MFRTSESFLSEARQCGLRLSALRKDRGWTLDKPAEHTGVDLKHIQMIEADHPGPSQSGVGYPSQLF